MQVDSIIDQSPMQSMQWGIFLASGIGWGFDMFAFTSVSILLSDAAGLYGLPGECKNALKQMPDLFSFIVLVHQNRKRGFTTQYFT
jgi:hypothetical protein